MNKINNKHGIEFYYEFSTEYEKMYVLDTNGKYFDDLLVDLVNMLLILSKHYFFKLNEPIPVWTWWYLVGKITTNTIDLSVLIFG